MMLFMLLVLGGAVLQPAKLDPRDWATRMSCCAIPVVVAFAMGRVAILPVEAALYCGALPF